MEGTGLIYDLVQYIKNLIQQIIDYFRDFNDNH